MTRSPVRRVAIVCLLAAAATACSGCIGLERRGERLYNSLGGVKTVVVAPMMNLSTNPRLNMVDMTEAFASELEQVEGLHVVPLGRVYQYLSLNNMATVGSPAEARALVDWA